MPDSFAKPLPLSGRDRVLYAKIELDSPEDPLGSLLRAPKAAMGGKLNPSEVTTLLFSYLPNAPLEANERLVFAFEETAVVKVEGPGLTGKPVVPSRRHFLTQPDPAAAYARFLDTLTALDPTLKALFLGDSHGPIAPIHLRQEGSAAFVHLHFTDQHDHLLSFHRLLLANPEYLLVLLSNPTRPLVELDENGVNTLPPTKAARFNFALAQQGAFTGTHQTTAALEQGEPSLCGKLTGTLILLEDGTYVIEVNGMLFLPWPPPNP